jgi:hypothetical protein
VARQTHQLSGQDRLLLSVVEQLSRPLLHMSRMAELATQADAASQQAHWQTVRTLADSSLQLAESYALSLRLDGKLSMLELQPLTVSSLLYDTAHLLEPYAKEYGLAIELDTGPRVAPVLADRQVLQSALLSLGQVFVQGGAESGQQATIRLAAHRGRYGVVAGLYSSVHELGADSLRQARSLYGRAYQPLQRLTAGPAAGVFVADALLGAVASHLHVARYHKLTGLAATLTPSAQLRLV